jgi:hypothetical protein
MTYDTLQFYNTALAIVAGAAVGALSFRLLPPLSPSLRTTRLLAMTLRDLRRLATIPLSRGREGWVDRMYMRLAAVPDAAEPLARAQLVAAQSVGIATMRLRRVAPLLGVEHELEMALTAFARADSLAASVRLMELDRRLAALSALRQFSVVMRARARILLIRDALSQHRVFFDAGAGR